MRRLWPRRREGGIPTAAPSLSRLRGVSAAVTAAPAWGVLAREENWLIRSTASEKPARSVLAQSRVGRGEMWREPGGLRASGTGTSGLTNGGQGAWAGLCPWRGLAGEHEDAGGAPAPAGARVLSPPWTALPWLRPASGAASGAWNRVCCSLLERSALSREDSLKDRLAEWGGCAQRLWGHLAVWPGRPHPLWAPLWKGSKANLPWQSPSPGESESGGSLPTSKLCADRSCGFQPRSEAEAKCRLGQPAGEAAQLPEAECLLPHPLCWVCPR